MPVHHTIDHERRLLCATAVGRLTIDDFMVYQRDVCAQPELRGYRELIDLTAAESIVAPSGEEIRALAALAASFDHGSRARMAVVADRDLLVGLAHMYQAFRHLEPRSTRELEVFRDRVEALAYLGVTDPEP